MVSGSRLASSSSPATFDKAKVEVAVLLATRRIIAAAQSPGLLDHRVERRRWHLGASRRMLFEDVERPMLKPRRMFSSPIARIISEFRSAELNSSTLCEPDHTWGRKSHASSNGKSPAKLKRPPLRNIRDKKRYSDGEYEAIYQELAEAGLTPLSCTRTLPQASKREVSIARGKSENRASMLSRCISPIAAVARH
jgi:hypothetical protein